MIDAIVGVIMNYEIPAVQFLREKYTKNYVDTLRRDYSMVFNNPKVHKFIETGEMDEVTEREDSHGHTKWCAFCSSIEEYATKETTRLFEFHPPQGLYPRVQEHKYICDECLYQVSVLTEPGIEAVMIDTCIGCEDEYLLLPEEWEDRDYKGTKNQGHCNECLINAGLFDEKFEQDHQCTGCGNYEVWNLAFKPVTVDNNVECASCAALMGPMDDDTDISLPLPKFKEQAQDVFDKEYGLNEPKNPKVYYYLIRYMKTRFGALIFSIDELAHTRLSFNICVLDELEDKIDYTTYEYGTNHHLDYDRTKHTHIERLMNDSYLYIEKYIAGKLVSI